MPGGRGSAPASRVRRTRRAGWPVHALLVAVTCGLWLIVVPLVLWRRGLRGPATIAALVAAGYLVIAATSLAGDGAPHPETAPAAASSPAAKAVTTATAATTTTQGRTTPTRRATASSHRPSRTTPTALSLPPVPSTATGLTMLAPCRTPDAVGTTSDGRQVVCATSGTDPTYRWRAVG